MSTRPEPAGYVTVQGYIFDGVEYDPTTGANPAYEGDSATTIEFKPAVSYVVDAAVHALVLPGTYPGQLAATDDPGGAYFAGYLLDAEGNQGVRLPVSGQPDQWGWNATVTQPNGTVKTFSLPQPLVAGTVYDLDELLPVAATPGTPTVIGPSPVVDFTFAEGESGSGITSTQTGAGTSDDPYAIDISIDPDLVSAPVEDPQVAGYVNDADSETRAALDDLYASASDLASKASASDLTAETTRAEAAEAANASAASAAQTTANAAMPKAGGTGTGTWDLSGASDVKAPTPALGDNDTSVGTTAFVNEAVAGQVVSVATSTGALDLSGYTALNPTFECAAFTGNMTFDASAKRPTLLSGVMSRWRIIVKQPASGTTTNTFTVSNAVWLTGAATAARTGASAATIYDFISDGTTVFVSATAADISALQAGAWQTPTLNTGYTVADAVAYRQEGSIVRLRGSVNVGSASATIVFTLPSGYRPLKTARALQLAVSGSGATEGPAVALYVGTDGTVNLAQVGSALGTVVPSGYQYVGLDIAFSVT